ncbi:hypothetical protein K435DRAFT_796922 [Dendrothele bispora CBS 962.96]|uniref:Uncharacterized protein n=1 Tax=Dendrothele bispora (strain CBS 962.96) TaxID=1314807 RepID=A0A4S8KUD1_DENBC|nr:hypothetical protein K435DRAFT_884060 [Dendrothele bispora CBS 962.96]THU96991.1 hypothetical protein K435DRAFT_796922 [Dendrothele bispora CBS 962.96]
MSLILLAAGSQRTKTSTSSPSLSLVNYDASYARYHMARPPNGPTLGPVVRLEEIVVAMEIVVAQENFVSQVMVAAVLEGSNGIIGCCPDGKICTGPAPPSGTNGDDGSFGDDDDDSTTSPRTRTSTSFSESFTLPPTPTISSFRAGNTSTGTRTPPGISSSSPTFYTPQSTPSADSGYTNVFVPANHPQITWSTNEWDDVDSACDHSKQGRRTTTAFASFTYITSSNSSGASAYIDISYEITNFNIYINGEKSDILSFDVQTCTFYQIGRLPTGSGTNITIQVTGPLMSGRRRRQADSNPFDDWSFEFNGFMVGQSTASSDTGSLGTGDACRSKPAVLGVTVMAVLLSVVSTWF